MPRDLPSFGRLAGASPNSSRQVVGWADDEDAGDLLAEERPEVPAVASDQVRGVRGDRRAQDRQVFLRQPRTLEFGVPGGIRQQVRDADGLEKFVQVRVLLRGTQVSPCL